MKAEGRFENPLINPALGPSPRVILDSGAQRGDLILEVSLPSSLQSVMPSREIGGVYSRPLSFT